jgi:hypothetical protein
MKYHIKAWASKKHHELEPTIPLEHFSVFSDSEREARKLLTDLVIAGYPNPFVLLHGPHGPETFQVSDKE